MARDTLRMTRRSLSSSVLVAALIAVLAQLGACGQPSVPKECASPPVVNGQVALPMEDGQTRIRVSYANNVSWTYDCKYIRLISANYKLSGGRLVPIGAKPIQEEQGGHADFIPIWIQLVESDNPAGEKLADWQFDTAVPHKTYPLIAYPKTAYFPSGHARGSIAWGVKGTIDPITGRPYMVGCEIPPRDPGNIESAVEGQFSRISGKCRGMIRIKTSKSTVVVSLDVFAPDIAYITDIYNLVAAEFVPRVEG